MKEFQLINFEIHVLFQNPQAPLVSTAVVPSSVLPSVVVSSSPAVQLISASNGFAIPTSRFLQVIIRVAFESLLSISR